MMLPTHVLVGIGLAVPVGYLSPGLASAAFLGGILGSVAPDLDVLARHRRTLHFPTLAIPVAGATVGIAILVPTAVTVVAALFLVAMAAHAQMDRFGGGLDARPWEGSSDRAVYDHLRGAWKRPRRGIRYDGSPEDLLLCVALALPLTMMVPTPIVWIVIGCVVVASVYTSVRRRVPALEKLVGVSQRK